MRSLNSSLTSDVSFKVIWRPTWPQRPPKWPPEAISIWIPGVIEVTDFKSEGGLERLFGGH